MGTNVIDINYNYTPDNQKIFFLTLLTFSTAKIIFFGGGTSRCHTFVKKIYIELGLLRVAL